MKRPRLALPLLALLLLAALVACSRTDSAIPEAHVEPQSLSPVVISQVYGGGGNTDATYTHDYIELFNRSANTVSINGWSVQYAAATGSSWTKTDLSGTIEPGQYYLIQQAAGSGGTTALPSPNITGSINLSATAGKVALVRTTTLSGACPSSTDIVDFVGYGTTNCFEGGGASPAPSNTQAIHRLGGGCIDRNRNDIDFAAGDPSPRNSASPSNPCTASTNPSGTGAATPDAVTAGSSVLLRVTVFPGTNPPSTGLNVTADLRTIGGLEAQTLYDDGTNGDAVGGNGIYSFQTTVAPGTGAGVKKLPVRIADSEEREGSTTITLNILALPVPPGTILISQVYGGGGDSGPGLSHDFVELFNPGPTAVDITGWSVQYAQRNDASWQVTPLSGTIGPGQYYLVQQAGGNGTPLTTPDATGSSAMDATAGKVALVTGLAVFHGRCPTDGVVDLVGYGNGTDCAESEASGSGPTPNLSSTTAALRRNSGCTDTNRNNIDFIIDVPSPRNLGSPPQSCTATTNPLGIGNALTDTVGPGNTIFLTVAVIPGTNPPSIGLRVTGDLSPIGGSPTQVFYDDGSNYDLKAGDNIFSYYATVAPNTTAGNKTLPVTITDAQGRSGSDSISLTILGYTIMHQPVVISQIYGGGGNSGATYTHDFIELYNRGSFTVSLDGWSIQHASASGTSWEVAPLFGTIEPGGYYLIQLASGGSGGTTPLPTPDATGSINVAAGAGKVALLSVSSQLLDSCPINPYVSDFVGYGGANCYEGGGSVAALSSTTAAIRKSGGAQDTDNNAADFEVGVPNPRNSATTNTDLAPFVVSTVPADGATDVAVNIGIAISFSEPVNVVDGWFSISCNVSGSVTATASGGPTVFALTPTTTLTNNEVCTVTIFAAQVTDRDTSDLPDTIAEDYSFSFTTTGAPVFDGFFPPVDNGVVNVAKAGSAIPIRFSLGADFGLSIFAAGHPVSRGVSCDTLSATAPVEETVTAGNSSLSYDAGSSVYTYVWKTEKSWSNTCRNLTLKFGDGSEQTARFRFSR